MIVNQQKGLRHSLWITLTVSNLILLSGLAWADNFWLWFDLHPAADLLPYQLGIVGSYFYLIPFIGREMPRLLRGRYFGSLYSTLRIVLAQGFVLLLVYFLQKDVLVSRAFLTVYLVGTIPVNLIILLLLPALFQGWIVKWQATQRAVLVADPPFSDSILDYMKRCRKMGVEFVGFFGSDNNHGASEELPRLGTLAEVRNLPENGSSRIDSVLFFRKDFTDPKMRPIIRACLRKGLRVEGYSFFGSDFEEPVELIRDGDMHFLTFGNEPLLNPINNGIKRIFDIFVSIPAVLLLLPPITLLVWLVQLRQAPGAILFRQSRYGKNRGIFQILKFRTMYVRATEDEKNQACKNDHRIYPFGHFLRRTSLDEFPQFLNVLFGEMSIVGPRPHLLDHDDKFEKHVLQYRCRHFVKPGITGLAQIHGLRGEINAPEEVVARARKDLYYITHWNLRLDFWIFLKTILQIFIPPKTAR